MSPLLARALERALTGGLHVDSDHDDQGCSIEAVMANIAAAQLRAIRMALVMGEPDDVLMEEGRGWCVTDHFTRLDAVAAIGGVMALLQDSHYIAEEVRRSLEAEKAALRDLGVLEQVAAQKAVAQ